MEERMVLTVEKLASGGDGIAFLNGQAVFLPFSIPGETHLCEIVSASKDYLRARIIEPKELSPHRAKPPCPLFGLCGGCALQHMEYPKQLELKKAFARESLTRIAKFDPGELSIRSGEPYGYRNRVQVHIAPDHGIGFMKADSNDAVRARGCPVCVGPIDAWLRKENKRSKPDREIEARIGKRERFTLFAQDDRLYVEGETAFALARVGGIDYRFPLSHFFQSNLGLAPALAKEAVQGASGERAADLYAGAGLFSARLARSFGHVDLVESDTVSLEAARNNVTPGKGRFHGLDVNDWAKAEMGKARKGNASRYDWVVLDPPRTGLSTTVKEWLFAAQPGGVSYVSCDLGTFSRDLGEFLATGWKVEYLELFDFYPQTGRLEALARLSPPRGRTPQGA
ncbi:MAG: TRAM domain-containing protein [Spirochaetota bacterium]